MKGKLLFSIFCLMLLGFSTKAQIGNEIKAYVDSTEVMVNNGRKFLLQTVLDGNRKKTQEIYTYLQETTKGKRYSAFYYNEDLYISLIQQDWQQWLEKAAGYNQYSKATSYANCYPVYEELYSEIVRKSDTLSAAISLAKLSDEEKSVLHLYLHLLKVGTRDEAYNKMARDISRTYANSKYQDFLSTFMPSPSVKYAMSFTFGPSILLPTGSLGSNFSANTNFIMSWDINVSKVYCSLYLTGGSFKLKKPFAAATSSGTFNFGTGEDFSYFEGGLLVGYFLVRNSRIHLAPFVTIAGNKLESNMYDGKNKEKEVKIYGSFITGPGIHSEVKFFDFTVGNAYRWGSSDKNYISIKLDAGYSIATSAYNDQIKGNMGYLKMGLAWGFGDF